MIQSDLKAIHQNPFDFERPVKERKFFAGRYNELKEIDYYLELASAENPTFFNISVIGKRASGKTSFLNMIAGLAEEKNLLPVKISLNNDLARNEVAFFKEIFDGIMTVGAKKGMFGGFSGKVYGLFRKAVDMLEIEAEFPFLFGTAYIGMKKQEGSASSSNISQHILVHDLKKFHDEANTNGMSAIVLLFDECDLLATNETLLQKLRNIFSEIDGYILVFSGTEKMFPALTEVFSPIPRLFKRIDMGSFQTFKETEECILNRLSPDERQLVERHTVNEIHSITDGNPYEVQLISHFMYKHYKANSTKSIAITPEILDSVTKEIDRLRHGGHNAILDRIKKCNKDELDILRTIIEFPLATKDQIYTITLLSNIEKIDAKSPKDYQSEFLLGYEDLKEAKVIHESDGVKFAGDEFDELYLKYHLHSKDVTNVFHSKSGSFDAAGIARLTEVLQARITPYFYQAYKHELADNKEHEPNKIQGTLVMGIGSRRTVFPFLWLTYIADKDTPPEDLIRISHFYREDLYKEGNFTVKFMATMGFLNARYAITYSFKTEDKQKASFDRLTVLLPKLKLLGILVEESSITKTNKKEKLSN